MSASSIRLALIADTTCDVLAGYLKNLSSSYPVEVTVSPYGQAMQILLNRDHDFWKTQFDFALIVTQPDLISESFNQHKTLSLVHQDNLQQEVKIFSEAVLSVRERIPYVFLTSWLLPLWKYGSYSTDFKMNSIQHSLLTMNYSLMRELEKSEGIYILNSQTLVGSGAQSTFSPKLWYTTKQIYPNIFFKNIANETLSIISNYKGNTRKLIILDLDDTLWGGVVGDLGWNQLRLGGHDPVGEAFVDFQIGLKKLKNSGIILAISSKNDESVALNAIKSHPEMVLQITDFAAWKINWNDKAQNIHLLLQELNLGPQSAVFIDNSPVERSRVQLEFPEMLVPDWPTDETDYLKALTSLSCFDKPTISFEDHHRTEMMAQEAKRRDLKNSTSSIDGWLSSLGIKCYVEPLNTGNLNRVVQLLNKTNQMNLKTRRLSPHELTTWCSTKNNKIYAVRVQDKFGDYGLTGIIGVSKTEQQLLIEDYILSCRVMGRKVEETMLSVVYELSKRMGCKEIVAQYLKTEKNQPCYRFFKSSGFEEKNNNGLFTWDTKNQYPAPNQIEIDWNESNG